MTYCGSDCCGKCDRLSECKGCESCGGHPFGGSCIAERNKNFPELKLALIEEINSLKIDSLFVKELYLLGGSYVNLSYPLPSGESVKLLNDKDIYLGAQVEKENCERCLGVVANEDFILVSEYACEGSDAQIVLFKRR